MGRNLEKLPGILLIFFPLFHSLGAFVTLSYLYIVPVCVG